MDFFFLTRYNEMVIKIKDRMKMTGDMIYVACRCRNNMFYIYVSSYD